MYLDSGSAFVFFARIEDFGVYRIELIDPRTYHFCVTGKIRFFVLSLLVSQSAYSIVNGFQAPMNGIQGVDLFMELFIL